MVYWKAGNWGREKVNHDFSPEIVTNRLHKLWNPEVDTTACVYETP